jgi:thiol-disulfide isomerase/thioredoxin
MKRILACIILILLGGYSLVAQNARIIKLSELEDILKAKTDKIQVINFWATWCAPCVKEMPIFEKANNEITEAKVTLISLDLNLDPAPEKVYRFIERKKLASTVFLLDETDPNFWIDKIDKRWSGALPATLVLNTKTGKRQFVEHELAEDELETLIATVK